MPSPYLEESDQLAEIPQVSLQSALNGRDIEIQLRIRAYLDGMLPSEHALALVSLLVAEKPTEVLKNGTYMGHTTKLMAINLPAAKIHTVDLPLQTAPIPSAPGELEKDDFNLIAGRVVGREFRDHSCSNRITQHFADTAHWDFAAAGTPGFFFIDGAHTYDNVKNGSEKCLALCASRPATFVWHDCDDQHRASCGFCSSGVSMGAMCAALTVRP